MAAARGRRIRFATSRRRSRSVRGSTRRISRASSGISGLRRSRRGAARRGWSRRRRASTWVVATQARLADGSDEVLTLFRRDPFGGHPPAMVRTVLWQYWFTDAATKRATGAWWRRTYLGDFAGVVSRDSVGQLTFTPATTE